MKKLVYSILLMVFSFSLVGCQEEVNPKETVIAFLESYKNKEFGTLGEYFTEGLPSDEELKVLTDAAVKELGDDFLDLLVDIGYSAIETNAFSDDKVQVNLNLTSNNIMYQLGIEEAKNIYQDSNLNNSTQEEIDSLVAQAFFEPLKNCEKNYSYSTYVNLSKVDGQWLIDTHNNGWFYDVLSGGLSESPLYLKNNYNIYLEEYKN